MFSRISFGELFIEIQREEGVQIISGWLDGVIVIKWTHFFIT